jgi:hypothetical protein
MVQAPNWYLDSSELIDRDSSRWNVPLIENIFLRNIAEQICGLAICPRLQSDRLIWARTKNMIFLV